MRSASALGVDGLLLTHDCADPLYRRCVRVSMGEVLFLPWTRLAASTDWPTLLAGRGFTTIALTPDPRAEPIDTVEPPEKVALLLGAEGHGLSPLALRAATRWVRIPLRRPVDSLNVGHAAAIAFHHFAPRGERRCQAARP